MFKNKQEKVNDNKQSIISFDELYKEQFEWHKKKFNLLPDRHRVTIVTHKDTHYFNYIDIKEAQSFYEEILRKWKTDVYIKLDDNLIIGSNGIISIEFKEGKHPKDYTQDEINQWTNNEMEHEMKLWKIVKPELKHCMFGSYYYYDYDI